MLRSLFGAALVACAALGAAPATAQHLFHALVRDAATGEPLVGASVAVAGTRLGAVTDGAGRATVTGIGAGRRTVVVSYVGYAESRRVLTFPLAGPPEDSALVVFDLAPDEDEGDEVLVTTTRVSRTIDDVPTRVETIAGEEIDEKVSMDPSNLTMLLAESPGIVVQQTSAVTANASFRVQGLDGRYTQLLRDGFPLYGGFGGGLSILQVPPLDLARVEVIKGPASTLYGGDAIAGLVNLISRTPGEAPERSLLLNATSAGGLDAGFFGAGRGPRVGYTLLAAAHAQRAYDAEGDGFTNLPRTRRLTLAPTLFAYDRRGGTLRVGAGFTGEVRTGGYRRAVEDDAAGYTERNASRRATAFAGYERPVGTRGRLGLRASASRFHRDARVAGTAAPGTRFSGDQRATFAEATLGRRLGPLDAVGGLDLRTDHFDEHRAASGVTPGAARDYAQAAAGAFLQGTWDPAPPLALETGLRVDATRDHGAFVLPRAAALVRLGRGVTARLGGGLGYKQPTIFLEPSEERAFAGVRPIAPGVRAETATGGTFDVNASGLAFGHVPVSLNVTAFHTRLRRPLGPVAVGDSALAYVNLGGHARTRGVETSARLDVGGLKLFLGYVLLDAAQREGGRTRALPLTARHRTYTVLVWEREGRARVGVEAYYTGPQTLPGGGRTPGFLVGGVMGERRFGRARLFVNLENVGDARQSRTTPLVTGPPGAPRFAPLWGPTDGFVANGGVKLAL